MWMLLWACQGPVEPVDSDPPDPAAVARGWDALRYGDFVGAGVPADLWFDLIGTDDTNLLDREGRAAGLPPEYNLFEARNGVEVVGGLTCFGCHSATIEGTFYPGIGDPRINYANDAGALLFDLLQIALETRYGRNSPEWEAAFPLLRGGLAVAPAIETPFAGVNPAFSLERAAVANRDPETLEWLDTPVFDVPEAVIWSDTPPWWHLKKRSNLYWTGFGRGEVERLLLQISVVAVEDVSHAEELLEDFDDIRAWIEAVEPPAYPGEVDAELAAEGQVAFEATCSACHGTYGDVPTYPDRVIPLAEVGTDPVYAAAFSGTPFADWLAQSWFGSSGDGPAGEVGYIAPPLDGVWATAPYFHNGSVPNLVGVLDAGARPATWRRDPDSTALDHERMGWPYTEPTESDAWTYDTSVEGAGAGGHRFGDALDDGERRAVLEYLKTL